VSRWPAYATWGWPALWAVLTLVYVWRLAGGAPDDMYITYRYAWNLSHGEGFVFNPGERIFGDTEPGLGLILAGLHLVTRIPIHILGSAVFGLSLLALATLVWLEARSHGFRFEAALGGTLVVSSSAIWVSQGSAAATVLALLAGAALWGEQRAALSGALAGAAVWWRPDAGLGVGAVGLLLWIGRRRFPLRWTLAAGAVVLGGVLLAWAWFGTAVPLTFEAKRLMDEARQVSTAGPVGFWERGTQLLITHWRPAWLPVVALGIAGIWPVLQKGGRALRTVVLYGFAVAIAYPLLGVPFFSWYIIPTQVAILYGLCGLCGALGRGISARAPLRRRFFQRWAALTVAALALAVPLTSPILGTLSFWRRPDFAGRYATYREAGVWIREHSAPEDRIAFGEIGNLAYWSQRPVDDMMGLVTPRALPFVAVGDSIGAFRALRPDFWIRHDRGPQAGLHRLRFFRHAYELVARIEPPPDGNGEVLVFRRRPGAPLPEPRPPRAPRGASGRGKPGG
jgi:arabinofuranosyltransferase